MDSAGDEGGADPTARGAEGRPVTSTSAPPSPPLPPPPPPQPPGRASRTRLHRSRRHRVLGGVAAGIAETYGIDLLLVRVLWVLAAIAGFGAPVYLVAWLLLPYGDETDRPATEPERARERWLVLALALIVIGVFVAFEHAWRGPQFEAITWPVFLILGGLAILFLRGSSPDDDTPPPVPPVDPPSEPAPESTTHAPTPGPAVSAPGALPVATAEGASPPEPPTTAWTQTAPWPTTPPRPPRERRRERPFLTPVTLSILLIGAGVVALLHEVDAIDVNLTVVLAIGLGIVALALIVSAWVGRARGLIFVGLLLAAATGLSSVVDVPLHGGWGERHYHPTSSSLLAHNYELAGGQLFVDLRDLPVHGVERVKATLGFGQLDVDVPSDVRVVVRAHAGAGSLQLFGHDDDGIDVSARELATPTAVSPAQRGTIQLDLRVGAGAIRVTRFDRSGNEISRSSGVNP